jgi:IS5 family transposase
VKCISKGKAHKRYEFGNKVSFATRADSHFIARALSFEDNLFDGKTLQSSPDQVQKLTGSKLEEVFVDKGYRGYTKEVDGIDVYHQGQRRGVNKRIKSLLKRRSRIEPVTWHLKQDHRLSRNYLLGPDGNEINAILAAAAFNFRKLPRELSGIFSPIYFYFRFFVFYSR